MAFFPDTERRNEKSRGIDTLPVDPMLRVINDEDKTVAQAVEAKIPEIARAVEAAERAVRNGGRVIYLGCGTSGRLGVLDASECPPTYGVEPGLFLGIIAGGDRALRNSIEGAEDNRELAVQDLEAAKLCGGDFLVGLAASGRTPYVLSGLDFARSLGCATALISCSKFPEGQNPADILISLETGPEVITGSTRMKAGTAQKLVLNMISTGTMIRLGKVYGNLMVDLRPSNQKLLDRAWRIIDETTGCGYEAAREFFARGDNNVKHAILIAELGVDSQEAAALLRSHGGRIGAVLEEKNHGSQERN
jgi:N-acetylmuramic acid 6-phosphate etherase